MKLRKCADRASCLQISTAREDWHSGTGPTGPSGVRRSAAPHRRRRRNGQRQPFGSNKALTGGETRGLLGGSTRISEDGADGTRTHRSGVGRAESPREGVRRRGRVTGSGRLVGLSWKAGTEPFAIFASQNNTGPRKPRTCLAALLWTCPGDGS